jgi:predicted DNA-binding transcriptional regulator YafY
MRRADRLFLLIQILRRGRVVTAADIAEELEVSTRTVYRDIADLTGTGVPIDGEAGVGYVLRPGFDMPPLGFTTDELEALALGARIVAGCGDKQLARAAEDVLAKVAAAVPEQNAETIEAIALLAPPAADRPAVRADIPALRRAIRERRKVRLTYRSERGDETTRVIRPLALLYFGPVWLYTGWCEMREDFRHFRLDRVGAADVLDETFPDKPGYRLADYLKQEMAKRRERPDVAATD